MLTLTNKLMHIILIINYLNIKSLSYNYEICISNELMFKMVITKWRNYVRSSDFKKVDCLPDCVCWPGFFSAYLSTSLSVCLGFPAFLCLLPPPPLFFFFLSFSLYLYLSDCLSVPLGRLEAHELT